MSAEYRVYRCIACRTAFVHPTPTSEQLSRYYDTFHLAETQGGLYDQIEGRMQADFPTKVSRVKARTGARPGRLLDVGCGKGYFVAACRAEGIDAEGCDLSASGVKHARDVLKVPAHHGLLADLIPTLGTFDTATFWATIEHVPDPVQTLREIKAVLKSGGRLFLDTGIGADWLDKLLPGRVQWYDPPQHLWVFSADGLRRAVESAGFIVEDHRTNFERTPMRKLVKSARNFSAALALRASATVARLNLDGFAFTRFPMGNLQSLVARVRQG
jgi:SAM-dependent methyltransferase